MGLDAALESVRDHFQWFFSMASFVHPYGNHDYIRRAWATVEAAAQPQTLRPLRWYTDARDGLCPDAPQ